MKYEYIICGGGIAGLYCALNLIEKNNVNPQNILIIEKNYRVGGLIKTMNNEKLKIKYENGARRFTENDKLLLELIRRFNLEQQKIELPIEKEYRKVFNDEVITVNTKKFSKILNKLIFKKYNLTKQELLGKTFRSLCEDEIGIEKTSLLIESFGYTDEFNKVNAKNGIDVFKKNFSLNIKYYILRDGLEQIILQLESFLKKSGVTIHLSEKILNIEENHPIIIYTESFDGQIDD